MIGWIDGWECSKCGSSGRGTIPVYCPSCGSTTHKVNIRCTVCNGTGQQPSVCEHGYSHSHVISECKHGYSTGHTVPCNHGKTSSHYYCEHNSNGVQHDE